MVREDNAVLSVALEFSKSLTPQAGSEKAVLSAVPVLFGEPKCTQVHGT